MRKVLVLAAFALLAVSAGLAACCTDDAEAAGAVPFDIECTKGTDGCFTVEGSDGCWTVTFTEVSKNSAYSMSGYLEGCIVIDIGDDWKFELELEGLTVESYGDAPISILSGDEVSVSAKKGTVNSVYDLRPSKDKGAPAAIYAVVDLEVKGKGTLNVYSDANGGIRTKDDLSIKNLTLQVDSYDDALRGNDSVTITSGSFDLSSRNGDGIKTSNNAAKYSDDGTLKKIQGTVSLTSDDGKLSMDIASANDGVDSSYNILVAETDGNDVVISIRTSIHSGFAVETGDDAPSSKGLKADNRIVIESGTIEILSVDDGIHANSDNEIEAFAGGPGLGDVEILGGNVSISTGDDAVHADGRLTVAGGNIDIRECYEGLEGGYVSVTGGSISITSSDDGINSVATTGVGISISGGDIRIVANGDCLDSNSTSPGRGIAISGGRTVLICTSTINSAIDTERGFSYTGGKVVAVSKLCWMNHENINSVGFLLNGRMTFMALKEGMFLNLRGEQTSIGIPCSMVAQVVCYGHVGVMPRITASPMFTESFVQGLSLSR